MSNQSIKFYKKTTDLVKKQTNFKLGKFYIKFLKIKIGKSKFNLSINQKKIMNTNPMKEEVIDDFINGLDSNTQKELLDCLIIYNNTLEDIFTDTSVHICLYTSYIDSIKANLVYNESIMLRNRSCYFYCLFLGFYMIIGFYLGFNIGNKVL